MTKRHLFFLLLTLASFQGISQTKGEVGAAVAAGLIGVGVAALEFHVLLEQLENQAFNYVAENHPEYDAFRLKVLDLEGKKISDVGAMSVVTFALTTIDLKTGQEGERSVLMLLTSGGWMTEFGINLSLVKWSLHSRADWNSMFGFFINLNTPIEVDTADFMFNEVQSIRRKDFNADDSLHFELGGKFYWTNPELRIPALFLTLGRNGMGKKTLDYYGEPTQTMALPFYPLKNDDYIVRDYSSDYKVFANEKSMGLYIKSTKRSIQLQRSLVSEIHSFLNGGGGTFW